MFGWLKSLFGNETEQESIVLPPLPSKVKKAEKLVTKKVAKKSVTKKEAPKEEAPKTKATKAPRKKKEAVLEVISIAKQEEALVEEPKKKGRSKKAS
jgi:hypothetical protein